MQFGRFRHKGLKALHDEDNAKGVPSNIVDKLRKLLFALETADNLDQVGRFPGWKLHPLKGDLKGGLEPDCDRKLAADIQLRGDNEYCR